MCQYATFLYSCGCPGEIIAEPCVPYWYDDVDARADDQNCEPCRGAVVEIGSPCPNCLDDIKDPAQYPLFTAGMREAHLTKIEQVRYVREQLENEMREQAIEYHCTPLDSRARLGHYDQARWTYLRVLYGEQPASSNFWGHFEHIDDLAKQSIRKLPFPRSGIAENQQQPESSEVIAAMKDSQELYECAAWTLSEIRDVVKQTKDAVLEVKANSRATADTTRARRIQQTDRPVVDAKHHWCQTLPEFSRGQQSGLTLDDMVRKTFHQRQERFTDGPLPPPADDRHLHDGPAYYPREEETMDTLTMLEQTPESLNRPTPREQRDPPPDEFSNFDDLFGPSMLGGPVAGEATSGGADYSPSFQDVARAEQESDEVTRRRVESERFHARPFHETLASMAARYADPNSMLYNPDLARETESLRRTYAPVED